MSILDTITGPADVRALPKEQLPRLAAEVRQRLIEVVSQTGGHIGAGLGVVELTVALLHSFDSPRDKVIWDVGHQGYPWKMLTGRNSMLPTLRQQGGLSGFLRRTESEHDMFGAGHAGTSISSAIGMATARDMHGEGYHVVAVIGDGALTCGLPYEGMNNAGHSDRDVIIILNDNGMSIAPNVGAMSKYLGTIIASPMTNRVRELVKQGIQKASSVVGGRRVVDFAKNVEESIKNLWSPGMHFEELGFRYFGPIDGHDIPAMLQTLDLVKKLKGPRIVHVITEKGKGFPLEEPDLEKFHARNPYDPVTGELKASSGQTPPAWTKVFGTAIAELAAEHPELVAITAAMPSGTGTNIFQKKWPDRFFDVGIAEGHATTFAAGLATQGVRPIVAIYSTFLQRAYDSIIHDVAIQNLPVIFCMDRAGMVGADGQTHMGLYDIAYLLTVPNVTVTAPKDGAELIGLLRCALAHDGPFTLRYPRDHAPAASPPAAEVAATEYGTWEVLREGKDCAILAVGVMCEPAMAAATTLAREGFDVTVVNCRFLKPIDEEVFRWLVHSHRLLVTVEDGANVNGFGAYIASRTAAAGDVRVTTMGAPDRTYEHASRAAQLAEAGLNAEGIANQVRAWATEGSLSTR
jgi:1-deoxy-D-xylulose-5-phosphate synthase